MGLVNVCYFCGSRKNIDKDDVCDNPECQDKFERYFKYDNSK